MNEWVSELIFGSLFTSFMVWSFSPFFFQRKRFYTAVLFSRLLMVLVGARTPYHACLGNCSIAWTSSRVGIPVISCASASVLLQSAWSDLLLPVCGKGHGAAL